jgi:nitrate reductase gamma subunit
MTTFNAEIASGLAIIGMSLLFLLGATMNKEWALIVEVDYLMLAIGGATLGLGVWTAMYEKKHAIHTHHH